MAFWGVEVKCGKPVTLSYYPEKGRLHLTQATLGLGSSGEKSVLQCNVGDRPGVLLCSLLPEKQETCSLNLEFEEEEEVIFSVLGPTSVHLTGYYMPSNERLDHSDTSGEDITGDSEDFNEYSSDDEYEDDFIDDDDILVSSGVLNTGVKIEEIEDEEPSKEHARGVWKKIKEKKNQKAISSVNGAVVGIKPTGDGAKNELVEKVTKEVNSDVSESEDRDGFPNPLKRKNKENCQAELPSKKQATEGNFMGATDLPKGTALDVPKDRKISKKKKKVRNKEKGNTTEMQGTSGTSNNDLLEKMEQKLVSAEKSMEHGNNMRSFPSGLIIEELSMGKPDGKKASPGNKVSLYYTGKLKNGKIFDSNIGRKAFQFRIGVGDVISGWDIGVNGMRVGDKRRLTIPPSMGYGAKGAGEIPGNAWLVFDVELVNVK